MRRLGSGLGKWRVFALVIAAALLGNTLAGVVMPVHALPVSAAQLSAAGHGHDHGCCPAERTSCGVACAAAALCGAAPLSLPVRAAAEDLTSNLLVRVAQALPLPESTASLPESPPPRA